MSENSTNFLEAAPDNLSTPLERNKVFVTGGTGLVGSCLIEQLLKKGVAVKASYRTNIPDIIGQEQVEWVKGDVLDVSFLEEALKDINHAFHCAAIVSFDPAQKHLMFTTNVEGTANVVNTCINAGVKKLCFVSSVAALGKPKEEAEVNEEIKWSDEKNNSNYGKSKHLAEMEVWRGVGEGLESVIVNPSIILGRGNWNDGSSKIFKAAYEKFPWYTEGVTGFVDVRDVVEIMIQLMDSKTSGERFIVSSENLRYKDVFSSTAIAFGKKPPHKKVSPLIADLVWRFKGVKSIFTGEKPLLTRETARSAQAVVRFNNSKIFTFLPSFRYTPVSETINRVCKEFKELYGI